MAAGLAATLVAAVLLGRERMAESLLRRALADAGLETVALRVESVDWRTMALRDLVVAGDAWRAEIAGVELGWTWGGLRRGRIESLGVVEPWIEVDLREATEPFELVESYPWPIGWLGVADGRITVLTGPGDLEIAFWELEVASAENGRRPLQAQMEFEGQGLVFAGWLEPESSSAEVRMDGTGLRWDRWLRVLHLLGFLEEAALEELPDVTVEPLAVQAEVELQAGRLRAFASRLFLAGGEWRHEPVGRLQIGIGELAAALDANGRWTADLRVPLRADLAGGAETDWLEVTGRWVDERWEGEVREVRFAVGEDWHGAAALTFEGEASLEAGIVLGLEVSEFRGPEWGLVPFSAALTGGLGRAQFRIDSLRQTGERAPETGPVEGWIARNEAGEVVLHAGSRPHWDDAEAVVLPAGDPLASWQGTLRWDGRELDWRVSGRLLPNGAASWRGGGDDDPWLRVEEASLPFTMAGEGLEGDVVLSGEVGWQAGWAGRVEGAGRLLFHARAGVADVGRWFQADGVGWPRLSEAWLVLEEGRARVDVPALGGASGGHLAGMGSEVKVEGVAAVVRRSGPEDQAAWEGTGSLEKLSLAPAELEGIHLHMLASPERILLRGGGSLAGDRGKIHFAQTLADPGRSPLLAGDIHLEIPRLELLEPWFRAVGASPVVPTAGGLEAVLRMRGPWDGLSASGEVGMRGVGLEWKTGETRLAGLEGRLRLDSLREGAVSTPGPLRIASVQVAGQRAGPVTFAAGLEQWVRYELRDLRIDWMGGQLRMERFGGDLFDGTGEGLLELDRVEIGILAESLPEIPGRLSGRLSGRVPLVLRDFSPILRPGYLELDGSDTGRLLLEDRAWLTEGMSRRDARYGPLRQAERELRNLRIHRMRLDILPPDAPAKAMRLLISAEPEGAGLVMPVNLEVNLFGTIDEVLRLLSRSDWEFAR
ncbi:MAG: hypothetical protein EA425_14515 [Puniceicoccaceae bacterium]|nr:MAG: hypothetical protein EA425_14515 [Puniceicoccaceae bacterium]